MFPLRSEADQFENKYFAEMCSGSEAGSYVRLMDFVYHSTLGVRVITKKEGDLLEVLLLGRVKVDDIVEPLLLRQRLHITFFSENLLFRSCPPQNLGAPKSLWSGLTNPRILALPTYAGIR